MDLTIKKTKMRVNGVWYCGYAIGDTRYGVYACKYPKHSKTLWRIVDILAECYPSGRTSPFSTKRDAIAWIARKAENDAKKATPEFKTVAEVEKEIAKENPTLYHKDGAFHPVPDAPYYVTTTDPWFSGWGPAKNKINKTFVPCADKAEAERVRAYVVSRGDQKDITIDTKVKKRNNVLWSICLGWLDRADEVHYGTTKNDLISDINCYYAELEYEDEDKLGYRKLWDSRIGDLISLHQELEGKLTERQGDAA